MNLENSIRDLEINEKMDTVNRMEKIEELKGIKEGLFCDELNELLSIGREDMIESAIDLTDNKEKLENWKKQLLEENSENKPKVKELVLKMEKRKE
ncbi:MAG: hypothetical protein ACI4GW_09205 [Lachnospiraceae bacterium]